MSKRTAFVVISSVILLSAGVVIVIARGKSSQNKAIDFACKTTIYPALCVSTLLSYPGVERANPKDFAYITLNVTMAGVQEAYAMALNVAPERMDSTVQDNVFQDCRELLQDSMDHLNLSLANIAKMDALKPFNSQIENVQTWLSAALTNQETCLDGFRESTGKVDADIQENSEYLSKLLSNALAMINIRFPQNNPETKMFRVQHPLVPNRRRPLMAANKELNEGFPSWMSVADRKLLQVPDAAALLANVTVAKDGSGQYQSISEAVKNAPSRSRERYVIYVKEGVYNENVDVSKKKTNLMMVGDGRGQTILVSDRNVKDGSTTFRSATLAASGHGFIAQYMTFANVAGPAKHQAVALRVGGDFSAIFRCNIIGYQDTLYVFSHRQFYRECNIYGTVDFIFGNAAVVLQDCNIVVRRPMANQKNTITAQGRKDPNQNTGISVQNSRVVASRDFFLVKSSFQTYLGRPWKMYSRTVFIQSFLGDVIHPAGWLEWSGDYGLKSLYYGEYLNTGPGANVDSRVSWGGYRVIQTADEANNFTVANFVSGSAWLPSTGIPFNEGFV